MAQASCLWKLALVKLKERAAHMQCCCADTATDAQAAPGVTEAGHQGCNIRNIVGMQDCEKLRPEDQLQQSRMEVRIIRGFWILAYGLALDSRHLETCTGLQLPPGLCDTASC
ncbi:hypothetical protein Efla_006868 [Eimeria flavescens]